MASYYEYITLQGDTFDMIALDYYNEESLTSEIIQANPDYRNVITFDAGVILKVPVLEVTASSSLPPWKR